MRRSQFLANLSRLSALTEVDAATAVDAVLAAAADIDPVVAGQGANPVVTRARLDHVIPGRAGDRRPPVGADDQPPRAAAHSVTASNEQIGVTALGMSSPSVAWICADPVPLEH